jgi:hypothetical protein
MHVFQKGVASKSTFFSFFFLVNRKATFEAKCSHIVFLVLLQTKVPRFPPRDNSLLVAQAIGCGLDTCYKQALWCLNGQGRLSLALLGNLVLEHGRIRVVQEILKVIRWLCELLVKDLGQG